MAYIPNDLNMTEKKYICDGQICIGEDNLLGRGGFGAVYLDETAGVSRAVKCIPLERLGGYQLTLLDDETRLHKQITGLHNSILKFHDEIDDETNQMKIVISEYCAHGDMHDAIFMERAFWGRDDAIKHRFIQILDAIQAMHDMGIFHRDIKPENIFVRGDGTPVIGDFGFVTQDKETPVGLGTSSYMSPELSGLSDTSYVDSRACDVWALGILLFNMVTSEVPWEKAELTDEDFFHYWCNSIHFLDSSRFSISNEANNLFRSIFTKHGDKRIALPELRKRVLQVKTFFNPEKLIATGPMAPKSDCVSALLFGQENANEPRPAEAFASGFGVPLSYIMPVPEMHAQPIPIPRANYDADLVFVPGQYSSSCTSFASDTDSEGPETPETYPVDATRSDLSLTSDIELLDLESGSGCLPVRWQRKWEKTRT